MDHAHGPNRGDHATLLETPMSEASDARAAVDEVPQRSTAVLAVVAAELEYSNVDGGGI